MEYLSTHKKVIFIYLLILAIIPLSIYLYTNRKPHAGSCLILEEKYCKTIRFIPDPNTVGGLLATYKLPKGTEIFFPIEGEFSNTPKFLFKDTHTEDFVGYPGTTVTSYTDKSINRINIKYGFIFFKEKEINPVPQLKKGNIMAVISDKNIDRLGSFNLLVRITNSNNKGKTVNEPNLLMKALGSKR